MEEKKKFIDFNIDLAQIANVGEQDIALDLVERVSSVAVSCGFHAGNPLAIKNAILHCKHKEKVIGAHISLPNEVKEPLLLLDEEIESIVLYQLGALTAFAKSESLNVEFVRPHGEMYKLMATNLDFSLKVAKSVKKYSDWLVLYGASGNILKETSSILNINIAQEVLLNKPYLEGGMIDFDSEETIETGKSLIRLRRLSNLSELEIKEGIFEKIEFDTVHFSAGDVNVSELLTEASKIYLPRPVNYNNVVESGWV